jgi:transposase
MFKSVEKVRGYCSYSKDHRPDLKQAGLELMVSQDGGVPFVSKRWDGHASDTQIFQERADALITTLPHSSTPRYLVADAKLYHEAHAASLSQLSFITRIPHPLKRVSPAITQALTWDRWHSLDARTRYHRLELCHDGMAQRWLVVSSAAALERAEASGSKAQQRECAAIDTPLLHLPAQRVETLAAAPAACAALAKRWTYHQVEAYRLIEHQHSAHQGRPTPTTPIHSIDWQRHAQVRPDHAQMAYDKQHQACFVVGTTSEAAQLSDPEVIQAYKGQAQAEGGFRCLKDPRFFVSSWFVKKPCRLQGLLMVMTLALLVYSVTQRRLRQQVARQHETVPNQINQPTQRPTVRWVFQRLEGMHRVRITRESKVHDLIEGLGTVPAKILRLFGEEVCHLYQISPS